jgi:hypothetical protein
VSLIASLLDGVSGRVGSVLAVLTRLGVALWLFVTTGPAVVISLLLDAGWPSLTQATGLHRAIIDIWRTPKAVFVCGAAHLISWLLGGVKVMLACYFLGHDVSLRQGIVLESVSQAMKSVGFAIPAGVGVQEGRLLLLGPLCGLPASAAMALSLVKRLREVVLGVPALIASHRLAVRAGISGSPMEPAAKWP